MFNEQEDKDLFGSYQKRQINVKSVAIGVSAFILLSAIGYFVYWMAKPIPTPPDVILSQQIRDNAVMMLQFRHFSGEEFRQQILGKGRLEKYVQVNDEAFFTYPPAADSEFQQFLSNNFFDPAKIEFGTVDNDVIKLGDYKLPTDYASRFFRTSLGNIKIAREQTLAFPYTSAKYTLSMDEMNDFITDKSVNGGRLIAEKEQSRGPRFVFANHAIMIAKPGEPSLKRFVDDLLRDVGPSREERIQRIVDFVSNEIEYSYTEGYSSRETLKRPDETLMTRNGDCSNKTILLASLLEQIGEPYLLLYCPSHITVAVPQGNFSNANKLDFTWSNQNWVIAETTAVGFQVGKTKVNDQERLQTVNYVQDRDHVNVIMDANTYQVLNFW